MESMRNVSRERRGSLAKWVTFEENSENSLIQISLLVIAFEFFM
uniref:Uncharacterized protein n=1 Tax=Nelumbo nucifera TaxID=4432 RepID=A0A822Y6I9_NELNU|nr:TPA_asm: hypothetical protein HUJ06_028709 [Nelumbo nucifera]